MKSITEQKLTLQSDWSTLTATYSRAREALRGVFILRMFLALYLIVFSMTFIYLTFFAGYEYNAWNWVVAVPMNMYSSSLWPIYWGVYWWVI